MKTYIVAVFYDPDPRLRVHWRCYVRDYNYSWPGCCIHIVGANNSSQAKKLAVKLCKLHREEYLKNKVDVC